MNILVPNLGSTSLKHQLLEMPAETKLAEGRIERVTDYREAIRGIDTQGHVVDAVAFKTVHGGPDYRGTFPIDDGVVAALERFLPAAPVHNRIYLTGIRAFQEALPGTPLIAAFETEFHATMPERAGLYGVPGTWRDSDGIRHYGFHGASHEYVSGRVPEMLGRERGRLRLVSCHLGGSSSICAIDRGRSVDTTMGFSPQSGLENATRHGDLDPFAVLYEMERHGWSSAEIRDQLASSGGLAGLSGIAGGDLRDIEAAVREGDRNAATAIEVFVYQVLKTVGAYAVALDGLDAIAFTGGIGENAAWLRASVCTALGLLGVRLDSEVNENGTGDRVISATNSAVEVAVLKTNEELVVARRAYRCLSGGKIG